MSVLSFPRIFFQGFMEWDPCTFNNNDWSEFQTYDPVNAALNWSFLKSEGITPQNFQTTFRPWAIKLQQDASDNPPGDRVPCEWNMFGTHGVSFVKYEGIKTTVTGGQLAYNQPVVNDPLIGADVQISGDGGNGAGRLVDTNPVSPWSSQIYWGKLAFGDAMTGISGPRAFRMHSRWLNMNRIYTSDQSLTQPAAAISACFQTAIPYAEVNWPSNSSSQLITALQQAASQEPAIGIMVRFTAYVNVYFRNGLFNGIKQRPRTYKDLANDLAAAWAAWNNNGDTSQFFSNPCYSHVVGTLGVWNATEVASAPVGRYLAALTLVTPPGSGGSADVGRASARPARAEARATLLTKQVSAVAAPAAAPLAVPLGPLVANVDYSTEVISLDLNSTMPENGTPGEEPSDLTKTDFGPLTLGVVNGNGFNPVYAISYDQYGQLPYELTAGIIDIPFQETISGSNTAALLQSGTLAIQVNGTTALLEAQYSAQTDSRGLYVDEKKHTGFVVAAYNFGTISPNTTVLVAQYDTNLALIPTNGSPIISFSNGDLQPITSGGVTTNVTIVTTDETGVANVEIDWVAPGFAELAFYPYSGTIPPIPTSLGGPTGNGSFTYAYYTTVRALPADNRVPQHFVDVWNKAKGNQTEAWNFVYLHILYVYDMLFSVMLEYVDLGSQSAFASSISSIWNAISATSAVESTYAMPITRDLSAGKRLTLQLYIYLIAHNFNVPNFNVNSIPPGWAPPKS
ncbi:MAG TPA: hypothetical protein VGJ82_15875 [Thermoanaerobaculia bacterium]